MQNGYEQIDFLSVGTANRCVDLKPHIDVIAATVKNVFPEACEIYASTGSYGFCIDSTGLHPRKLNAQLRRLGGDLVPVLARLTGIRPVRYASDVAESSTAFRRSKD